MNISMDDSGVHEEHFRSLQALFDPGPPTTAHPSSSQPFSSPLSSVVDTDDLNLLGKLLSFVEPVDYERQSAWDAPADPERCGACSSRVSERNRKKRRVSVDGATSKGKSQSQRQREEIARLRQQIDKLGTKLAVLKQRKQQRDTFDTRTTGSESACVGGEHSSSIDSFGATSSPDSRSTPRTGCVERSWEQVAKRRQRERQNAEAENSSLRDQVSQHWMQLQSLAMPVIRGQIG